MTTMRKEQQVVAAVGCAVRAAVAVVALSALASAAGAQTKAKTRKGMELPPELQAGTSEATVTHRKLFFWPKQLVPEMLRFDPYRAVDFRQGWSKGRSSGPVVSGVGWTFQWSADTNAYEYSFEVGDGADRRWSCSCAAASTTRGAFFSGEHMGVGIPGHGQSRLACVVQPPDDAVEWRLELGVDLKPGLIPTKTAVGWARHASDEIAITGTERQATWGRAPGRLVGVVLTVGNRPVAAIDLVAHPAVIFGAELPAAWHDPIAALGAALLLFKDDLDPFPAGPG